MALQRENANINIDATYKILSFGFPILVCFLIKNINYILKKIINLFKKRAGITDANGKFFPTTIAISSSEDTWAYQQFFSAMFEPAVLMADAAIAITNGYICIILIDFNYN